MQLDHISYACSNMEIADVVQRIGGDLGFTFIDGGRHPSFGTRNFVLPLADGAYIEVVSPLDHPAAIKAPFGRAVQQSVDDGGGWMSWAVSTPDISIVEERLERQAALGHRVRPDGVALHWRQLGVLDIMTNPESPFFIRWDCTPEQHPSAGGSHNGIRIHHIDISCPERDLGPLSDHLTPVMDRVQWVDSEYEQRGIVAVWFETAQGLVCID